MNILVVEDEPSIADQLAAAFDDSDYQLKKAATLNGAETLLRSFWPDFVILDANFPTADPAGEAVFNAEKFLELLPVHQRVPPHIILISGYNASARHFDDIRDWLRTDRISDVLPKSGAWDFLRALLRHRVELLRRSRFRVESTESQKDQDWLFSNDIISREPALLRLVGQIRNIVYRTNNEWAVLITGPNGGGKGLVARAISREMAVKSGRPAPFVTCSCGAIPETLAESELFGSVPGAHNDATDRAGLLEQAKSGVLFLDDIHLLPRRIQGALLDALQNRQFRRLDDNQDRRLDARVVAATNADFGDLLAQGSMTAEFYHRVARLPLTVPPLAQRGLDIEPLVAHFARSGNSDEVPQFHPDVIKAFQRYSWPGNVRQLQTIIQRIRIEVRERLVTMPILKDLKLDCLGRAIEWDLASGLPPGPENEEDILLLRFGWLEGWSGLREDTADSLREWLKQSLAPDKAGLVADVGRQLDARAHPTPKAIHYLKAWLFLALTPEHKASHQQLMTIMELEWDFTNRIACFLAGIKHKEVPAPLEVPVLDRNQESGRWVYRLRADLSLKV